MEPPEYEREYFGVSHRSSRSSGIWMDSFISDDDDELHYKPATGTHIESFGDRSVEEWRHFVMGLQHGIRIRHWPDGRPRKAFGLSGFCGFWFELYLIESWLLCLALQGYSLY